MAASNAVRQMQNFPFYGKPMLIQYAKSKSDCVSKDEGTFLPREKKMKQEEKVERKRHAEETQQPSMGKGPKGASTQNGTHAPSFQPSGEDTMTPNNILFIQNLRVETIFMMIQLLFKQYPGFKKIRMIEAKPGIAFVEYVDDVQSSRPCRLFRISRSLHRIQWSSLSLQPESCSV